MDGRTDWIGLDWYPGARRYRAPYGANKYFRLSKISFNLFSKEKLLLSLPGGKIRWDGLPDIEETSDSSNPHNFTKQDIKNWTQLEKS